MEKLLVTWSVICLVFACSHSITDGSSDVLGGDLEGTREDLAEGSVLPDDPLLEETLIRQEERPFMEKRLELFQYEPIELGHVHQVADESGWMMDLVTMALNPPVFEIHNFLSDEECDHVIDLAEESGLDNSTLFVRLMPSRTNGSEDEIIPIFEELDLDEDSYLDPAELANGLLDIAGGHLSEEDVTVLMADMELDADGDHRLDFKEFKLSWTPDLTNTISEWVKDRQNSDDTFHFSSTRVSEQTWLDQSRYEDLTLRRLHERVVKLLQLPRDIVVSSEKLQVVRYQVGGHYHAHFDSSDLDDTLRCSHTEYMFGANEDAPEESFPESGSGESSDGDREHRLDSGNVRLCRYATVLFYLNDVEEGGETAFPVADNETFSYEGLDSESGSTYDLSLHCYDSNLVVKPEKGKAVLWYNHQVNSSNGWMGDAYNLSLHGGCDVRRGQKWIANNWIDIDDNYKRQMDYHEFFNRELNREKEMLERNERENDDDKQTPVGFDIDDEEAILDSSVNSAERDEL